MDGGKNRGKILLPAIHKILSNMFLSRETQYIEESTGYRQWEFRRNRS